MKENYDLPKIEIGYLDVILEYLAKFFEMDRVSTTQVVLDYDLPVKYKLGGIKVHQYKTGTSFDKNTSRSFKSICFNSGC